MLEKKLKEIIKADKWLETSSLESETAKEEIKAINDTRKELREETKNNLQKEFIKLDEDEGLAGIFIEKVLDESLETISVVDDLYEQCEKMDVLPIIKRGIALAIDYRDIIKSISENGTSRVKNMKRFNDIKYVHYNRAVPVGTQNIANIIPVLSYSICRSILDNQCIKQGRLTKQLKIDILSNYIEAGLIDKFTNNKGKISYKLSKKQIDKEINKTPKIELVKNENGVCSMVKTGNKIETGITPKDLDKILMPIIENIYNISDGKISSLKTEY